MVRAHQRRRLEQFEEHPVVGLRHVGGSKPWEVYWEVGGSTEVTAEDIGGISAGNKSKAEALRHLGLVFWFKLRKMREQEDGTLFAYPSACQGWVEVLEDQIPSGVMATFGSMPTEQRRVPQGVPISTSALGDDSCLCHAIFCLFPFLRLHREVFSLFQDGAQVGYFVNFLNTTRFGKKLLRATRIKLKQGRPIDFLLSDSVKPGEKYFLETKNFHAVGVSINQVGDRRLRLLYCALKPDEIQILSEESLQTSSAGSAMQGKIWRIEVVEKH